MNTKRKNWQKVDFSLTSKRLNWKRDRWRSFCFEKEKKFDVSGGEKKTNRFTYLIIQFLTELEGTEGRRGGEGTKEARECEAIRSKLTIDSSETAAWHDPLPRSFPEIDDSVDVKIQSQK